MGGKPDFILDGYCLPGCVRSRYQFFFLISRDLSSPDPELHSEFQQLSILTLLQLCRNSK